MPRCVVQRSFLEALQIPIADGGVEFRRGVIENDAQEGGGVGQLFRERGQGQQLLRL